MEPIATIEVTKRDDGRLTYAWQGPRHGCIRISTPLSNFDGLSQKNGIIYGMPWPLKIISYERYGPWLTAVRHDGFLKIPATYFYAKHRFKRFCWPVFWRIVKTLEIWNLAECERGEMLGWHQVLRRQRRWLRNAWGSNACSDG